MAAVLDPLRRCGAARWSASVAVDGKVVDEVDPALVLPTASIGKLFLLAAIAEGIAASTLDPAQPLVPRPELAVADSGVLQHLGGQQQRLDDLAVLVAVASDNLATNVLLDLVGVPAVAEVAARFGAAHCGLHDVVRDERRPDIHPPCLSSGNAGELRAVIDQIAGLAPSAVGGLATVRAWLRLNTDLSMVAAAFGLDPLAHVDADLDLTLLNKTGTNSDVRADVGCLTGTRHVSYAVVANLDGGGARDAARRGEVLTAMRAIGDGVLQLAHGADPPP